MRVFNVPVTHHVQNNRTFISGKHGVSSSREVRKVWAIRSSNISSISTGWSLYNDIILNVIPLSTLRDASLSQIEIYISTSLHS